MKKFTKFLKDRSGATAVTFGLLLVPLLGMTGLAVDYSLASNERSKLQTLSEFGRIGWGVNFYWHQFSPGGGTGTRLP